MLIRIDPSSSEPLFEQLAASVRELVSTGAASAGERLPSARELAAALDVNVHTVLHAYQQLRDEGLIELRRGRGAILTGGATSVADLAKHVDVLVAEARRLGVAPATLTAMITKAYS
jgi:GntR family transcriptional regulator